MKILKIAFILAISFIGVIGNFNVKADSSIPKVMPLVYIQPTLVADETKTRNLFYDGIKKEFAKKQRVELLDFKNSDEIFREYMMENDITPDEGTLGNGFIPKKQYLADMAKEAGADYVLLINARITHEQVKIAWLALLASHKYEVSTLFNVYIYSVKENKYIYNDKFTVVENAAGTSSYERAFGKCCKTFIEKKFDLSNIQF